MAGSDNVIANLNAWAARTKAAVHALGENYAAQMEAEAKREGPWHDRTGTARRTLFGYLKERDAALLIRIAHYVDYGVYLELANSGRYAILLPTAKKFAEDFYRDIERVVTGR